jgi:cytochrome c-type biogenesis protein
MNIGLFPMTILFAAVSSLALTSCGGAAPASTTTVGSADTSSNVEPSSSSGNLTDFVLKDVNGRSHALTDYLGKKVILISFWATWCEPCKKEMVQLQALFDEHRDSGLMILSISMDEPETQGDVRTYIKQRGYTFPVLLDTETQVTNQLNPRRAAPFSLVIGKDEIIAWEHEGYVPGDEKELEEEVLKALGRTAP